MGCKSFVHVEPLLPNVVAFVGVSAESTYWSSVWILTVLYAFTVDQNCFRSQIDQFFCVPIWPEILQLKTTVADSGFFSVFDSKLFEGTGVFDWVPLGLDMGFADLWRCIVRVKQLADVSFLVGHSQKKHRLTPYLAYQSVEKVNISAPAFVVPRNTPNQNAWSLCVALLHPQLGGTATLLFFGGYEIFFLIGICTQNGMKHPERKKTQKWKKKMGELKKIRKKTKFLKIEWAT